MTSRKCTILTLTGLLGLVSIAFAQNDPSYSLYLTRVAAAEAFLQLNKISTARQYLDACDSTYRDYEWHFLHAALDQSKKAITGQGVEAFNDIKVSPDGQTFAVAASDSTIHLYAYPSLELIARLEGHAGSVSTLAFNDDGRLLASGGRDHAVIVWDLETHKPLWKNDRTFSRGIYQVRFSPDNKTLGVVSWELLTEPSTRVAGFAELLDASSGESLRHIYTEPHPAAGIVFNNGGETCIVSCWGQITFAYDTRTGEELWKYDLSGPEEYNSFHSIDISPDGTKVLLGSTDHRIHILDAQNGKLLQRIEPWLGHSATIKAVNYSLDGKVFASAGEDQTIYVWNATDNSRSYRLIGHTGTVTSLCWLGDGHHLLSSSADGTVRLWDTDDLFERQYDVCDNGPWQAPVNGDGSLFAAGCSDEHMVVYKTATGKPFANLGEQNALAADMSADGKLLVTASFDGIVRIWDIQKGVQTRTLEGHTGRIDGIVYLDKKDLIVSVGDTTLRVWSRKTGKILKLLSLTHTPFRINGSPDEQYVYVGYNDGLVERYRVSDWTVAATYEGGGDLYEMNISPDGKWLGVFRGISIEIWNTHTGKLEHVFEGHERAGYAIAFSPDSRYLITGSYDQTFRLWNLITGNCTLTYHGYQEIIYTTRFLDDHRLFIGSADGIMRYYDFGSR